MIEHETFESLDPSLIKTAITNGKKINFIIVLFPKSYTAFHTIQVFQKFRT